jgi:hypothetical protein
MTGDIMTTILRNISIAAAAVALALLPTVAFARDGDRDEKRVAGNCTGAATSKLKAKHDDGRTDTEFEVDQNRNGVTWKVRFRLNGERVVRTTATTHAPSGSFSVERKIGNPAGSDDIVARAISPSGQVCKASLTI